MNTRYRKGFSLALTMMMSVVALVVLFGIYRVVTAFFINTQESYYLKLAEEAASKIGRASCRERV